MLFKILKHEFYDKVILITEYIQGVAKPPRSCKNEKRAGSFFRVRPQVAFILFFQRRVSWQAMRCMSYANEVEIDRRTVLWVKFAYMN